MIQLQPTIDRIKALLEEDTEASVTYAALEARLALEKVCYDRLRQRHDYISHAQLKKWQPGNVINTLMAEVDQNVARGGTLSFSRTPAVPGVKPKDADFVELGTEIGFDPKLIARMWQALAKLALHVRLPEHKEDQIPPFGDRAKIRKKVEEVIVELERLSKGTMSFSGVPIGGDITFECVCGEKNLRRAGLLHHGQHVDCINPDCDRTWKVIKTDAGTSVEAVTIPVNCEICKEANYLPLRFVTKMRFDQAATFSCHSCRHKNYIKWELIQVRLESPS